MSPREREANAYGIISLAKRAPTACRGGRCTCSFGLRCNTFWVGGSEFPRSIVVPSAGAGGRMENASVVDADASSSSVDSVLGIFIVMASFFHLHFYYFFD
eukprot:CCRYP_009503-RD/>CCRYP_009503-RD protein AED:0.49 eAED:1.00 QI:0/0/0/1/0/0/2/0/100